ncbi:MAG: helix-turn-helix transcriptional regulator [Oscillospiraceae bacterium]|nr:helix-turn-helix transcriptional regulator [Oscillospiraceae bacterium]
MLPKKYKNYKSISLISVFDITDIYTVHYFEYDCDYVFKGEKHDFWELLFVDAGAVEVTAEERKVILEKGAIIFHQPNEFHALRAIGKNAPNLIVISFRCDSPNMKMFREKTIQATETEIHALGRLVDEARKSFCLPLSNPLRHRYDAPFGSEQIFKMYLELLLISLYRRLANTPTGISDSAFSSGNGVHIRLMGQITAYLQERVYQNLSVGEICRDNNISKSLLQKIFHEQKGCGVIEYFNRMKIDTAKRLIRENQYTYSQIASMLNYSSYQYFSLQFRKYTRMSPSEYHSSSQYFH